MGNEFLFKLRAWIVFAFMVFIFPLVMCLAVIRLVLRSVTRRRKAIAGEIALITGGANGLGMEIAMKLAAKGCHIAVVDINEKAATETATMLRDTYKIKAEAFKADVTQLEEVEALSKSVEDQLGPVSILVNNAGILTFSTSVRTPPSEIQRMINTNLTAHLWTIRVFLDKMRQIGKGHIVAISSGAGVLPCHRQLEYTATKFGVRGLMMALRTELYALNCEFINTTTVYPLFLNTNAKVVDLVQKGRINVLYPTISGGEVADAVIEGILTNEMEVFAPGFLELVYKILDFLPKTWYLKLVNDLVGRENLKKIEY